MWQEGGAHAAADADVDVDADADTDADAGTERQMGRVGSLRLPNRATSMGEWLVTAYDPELLHC